MKEKEDADFTCRRCWKARPGSLLAEYEGPMRRPICETCATKRREAMVEVHRRRLEMQAAETPVILPHANA